VEKVKTNERNVKSALINETNSSQLEQHDDTVLQKQVKEDTVDTKSSQTKQQHSVTESRRQVKQDNENASTGFAKGFLVGAQCRTTPACKPSSGSCQASCGVPGRCERQGIIEEQESK
jgi:hypothetical protein